MSERIFALLVRLYPAAFRRKYQEEAMELYRDRIRDECGLLQSGRLWFDLIADALAGLPIALQNSYAETSAHPVASDMSRLPSFQTLSHEPLRRGSVVAACIFSVTALVAFGLVMRLPAPHRFANAGGALSPVEAVLERLNQVMSAPTSTGTHGDGDSSTVNGGSSQPQANSGSASSSEASSERRLTAQEKNQVVQGVAENLAAHYFDKQKAEAAIERLRTLQKQGSYKDVVDGRMLAERLTADVRNATGDLHLNVAYSRNATAAPPSAAMIERYKAMMIRENCSVEKAEVLPGQVGYLKFNSFPELDICGEMLHKAMAKIGETKAMILDLRDNTGGFPETVADVASPLFDRTVSWYNPREAQSATTLKPAAGSKLANKPVYILTSSRTLSGAEQFTYNLKMLKRATVVGEMTGGGAHVGTFHRVDEHFGVGIPEAKITNPYGQPDWDVVGVEPDVRVNAADALSVAEKLAAKGVKR